MRHGWIAAWMLAAGWGAARLAAAATVQPATLPADVIEEAIYQLGDPSPQVRQKATVKLWTAGRAAETALEAAAAGGDPEIAARARQILLDFRHGIYPDTPPDVAELVRVYRRGNAQAKRAVVQTLTQMGARAYPILVRLSLNEPDKDLRAEIFTRVAARAGEAASAALAQEDYDSASQFLELASANGDQAACRAYAAYLLLTGKAPDKVRDLARQVELNRNAGGAAQSLAWLHRAMGRLDLAVEAAATSGDEEALEALLLEKGDFARLAELKAAAAHDPDTEERGFLAAYQRLAGQDARAKATLDAIAAERRDDPFRVAEALLLNDRPEQGIEILGGTAAVVQQFELLMAQQRYAEAMELPQKANMPLLAPQLAVLRGTLLAHLGEREKAKEEFARIGAQLRGQFNVAISGMLIEAEARAGLKAEATAHCAEALALVGKVEGHAMGLVGALYPAAQAEAFAWYRALRVGEPNAPAEQTLKRLAAVMDGSISADALEALARDALRPPMGSPVQEVQLIEAVVTALEAAGRGDAAVAMIEALATQSGTAESAMMAGRLRLQRKQWKEAAGWFGRASAQNKAHPSPMYLRGYALAQAGERGEGEALMARATLLPLARQEMRYMLAASLWQAGLADAAMEQERLQMRLGEPRSWHVHAAARRLSAEAHGKGDLLEAARLLEMSALDCLSAETAFLETTAYLSVPTVVHKYRAAGLIEAGKIDEAMAHIRQCQRAMPGDITVAIDLAPLLRKAGRSDEADKLIATILGRHEKLLADWPKSASLHNSCAWMLARCRVQLDKALEHAQRGVELAPDNVAIIDTLAEVYFQLGQKEKAIEAIRRCMAMEPRNARHRAALDRFERLGPESPPPEE